MRPKIRFPSHRRSLLSRLVVITSPGSTSPRLLTPRPASHLVISPHFLLPRSMSSSSSSVSSSSNDLLEVVRAQFEARRVIETLSDYVRVPNVSPSFDANVLTNGLQERAVKVMTDWLARQALAGMRYEVMTLPNRTPIIFVEIDAFRGANNDDESDAPAKASSQSLLYGHLDKQPPFEGWREGFGPYEPKLHEGKLYGRGAADDGYAVFSAITAIASLQSCGTAHGRCVIVIEASEESGSPDLPFYIEALKERIGTPNLVVCLDSGCGNYDTLWVTNSLRGIMVADLKVEVLTEGVHSGDASGVVPSTFRIARNVLSRLEDEKTGKILPKDLHASKDDLTAKVKKQVKLAAETLGAKGMIECFPFVEGCEPPSKDLGSLALARWWEPKLEITGAEGLPASTVAGNVLRPFTKLTLSLRLPPTVDKDKAEACVRKELTGTPALHGARVTLDVQKASQGWAAPPMAPWLETAVEEASKAAFNGNLPVHQGEGGSIPFMSMLGRMFPSTLFFVVGVLGPGANAHGPNEFLHIDYCIRLTSCVARVLAATEANARRGSSSSSSSSKDSPAKRAKKTTSEEDPAALAKELTRNPDGSKV